MSTPFLSEIKIMSFGFPPRGWAQCNGQLLPINQNQALFSLLGTNYGGDGRTTFGLPNLQGRNPMHMGGGHALGERGGEAAHTLNINEIPPHTHTAYAANVASNSGSPSGGRALSQSTGANLYAACLEPRRHGAERAGQHRWEPGASQYAAVSRRQFLHCAARHLPESDLGEATVSSPYIGEIRMFAGNFAPAGWLFCEGQLLPISDNDTLFNLIGTTYGGDGQSTFALPDLRGRLPIHQGGGYSLAQVGGVESVTLSTAQVPSHSHPLLGSGNLASATSPANQVLGGNPGCNDHPVRHRQSGRRARTGHSQCRGWQPAAHQLSAVPVH